MKHLKKITKVLCVFFLSSAIILVAFNVAARYIFNYGVPWCEEAIRYSVIFATFWGMCLAISNGQSMKIDVLIQLTKGKLRKFLLIFGTIVEFATLCCLFYFSVLLVDETKKSGQITPSTDYPMYLPYLLVACGVFFCALFSLRAVIKIFDWKDE